VIRSYVWGSDLSGSIQGAGGVGGLILIRDLPSAIGYCSIAYDGNGNVAGLVSMSGGTNRASYEYGPFGEVIRATGSMAKANPFRFSTKYQDDETDLLYYGYRYYSASNGRWLSRDPIDENGGASLYGFNRNGGMSAVDYLGLAALRFEVVTGWVWRYTRLAGRWSQPWWAGDGDFGISGSTAWSMVWLDNEFSWWLPFYDGVYCNTVRWTPKDNRALTWGNAGAILTYLQAGCDEGGRFRVEGLYYARLGGLGPARIYATAYLYAGWTTTQLSKATATQELPITSVVQPFSQEVDVPSGGETLVVRYEPLLGFPNRSAHGGQASFGLAEAMVTVTGVTKVR
jgi:RHS repeat-associated protein